MDEAKRDIDEARALGFIEWYRIHCSYWKYKEMSDDELVSELKRKVCWKGTTEFEYWTNVYEGRKAGNVLTSCNSRTLYKLQEMGLIEILRDSTGDHFGIDEVKILNY